MTFRFLLHLVEAGLSVCNRDPTMTGVKFLFRVMLRRHDLAAEIYHLKKKGEASAHHEPNEAERCPCARVFGTLRPLLIVLIAVLIVSANDPSVSFVTHACSPESICLIRCTAPYWIEMPLDRHDGLIHRS
jgi:hypothetical protein